MIVQSRKGGSQIRILLAHENRLWNFELLSSGADVHQCIVELAHLGNIILSFLPLEFFLFCYSHQLIDKLNELYFYFFKLSFFG